MGSGSLLSTSSMREGSLAGQGSGPPEAGVEGAGREQRPKRVSAQSRHACLSAGRRIGLPAQTTCGLALVGDPVWWEAWLACSDSLWLCPRLVRAWTRVAKVLQTG